MCLLTEGGYLHCHNEILADRVACDVDRCSPAGVQNGGDLPFINSFCPHFHIQPLVYFHFYVSVTGERKLEASILIGDDSQMILSMARWKLLLYNATEKQHDVTKNEKESCSALGLHEQNRDEIL